MTTWWHRFREIATAPLDDGIELDPESVRAEAIRGDDAYGGIRVRLVGRIGRTRTSLQIDIDFGDAVTPGLEAAEIPTLLDGFSPPTPRVYPVYAVIAEKYHAMVVLGLANSRMKDFYDVAVIARRTGLDGATPASAIQATFVRRSTPLPEHRAEALTGDFADDAGSL